MIARALRAIIEERLLLLSRNRTPFISRPVCSSMKIKNSRYLLLWIEGAGFLTLAVMAWFDEFHSDWKESALESGVVLAVWAIVHFFTWRLIARLHYLEGFLRVCAWCKKIDHQGKWVPIEEFFDQRFQTESTHGICPTCAAEFGKVKNG
jgi:hypothetical protein